jgi:hypothetical protein
VSGGGRGGVLILWGGFGAEVVNSKELEEDAQSNISVGRSQQED